jgi:hypothetical protein
VKLDLLNLRGGAWARLVVSSFTLVVALAGCQTPMAPPLATVDSVEPAIIEPGDVLRLTGTGFVEGPARVSFDGEFKPTGLAEPKRRTAYLEGTAVSTDLIEIPLSGSMIARLTEEPARFTGEVDVTFPAAAALDAIHISARAANVTFEIRPAGGGVARAARRTREAKRLLAGLGITLSESAGDGLLVAEVAPESAAARAGIDQDDRLLAVDGVALATPADLAGLVVGEEHRFELVSSGGTMRSLELLVGPGKRLDRDVFTAIILSSIALGLFLAFAAPTRRRIPHLAVGSMDAAGRAIGFGAVSVPLLLIPAASLLTRAGFGALLGLLGAHVLGLAALAFFSRERLPRRLLELVVHLAPAPLIIVAAWALSSAAGLTDIVSAQAAAPWGWHAWSSPFALALVLASVALLWPAVPRPEKARRPLPILTWLTAIPAAAMLTALGLGGWLVPGVPYERLGESSALLALGCLVFTLKTWLVLLAARWLGSAGLPDRRAAAQRPLLGWRFAILALAAASAFAWLWFDLPEAYRVAGQVLATAASVSLMTALATVALKRASRSMRVASSS